MSGLRTLSLKARALQLLAQREHSRVELRRKLLALAVQQAATSAKAGDIATQASQASASPAFSRRLPPTADMQANVDALLEWLVAQGHLSEARFVEARVRTRAARLGNLRIHQELAQHGLELSPEVAQALKDSEFARARQVWARKFEAAPDDAAARAKQMRYLTSRGFSSEVIRRLLRGDDD
jgi:regulatory protein